VTADVAVAATALALSSFAFAVWNVVAATERQAVTPPELLGRVTSAYRTLILGAAALGALVGGLVAADLGLRAPLLLAVPVLLLAAALGWVGLGSLVTAPGRRPDRAPRTLDVTCPPSPARRHLPARPGHCARRRRRSRCVVHRAAGCPQPRRRVW
jgi:MFS family permease